MIHLSKELQEYLDIKRNEAYEGDTDICTDFLFCSINIAPIFSMSVVKTSWYQAMLIS